MADEDVKIVIKQKGTIPVYTKTKVGVAEVHHDETLKGSGTISAPLGISDEVMEEIENAGKIDDVRVDGVSVVTDKIAEIDLTGKVDKTSEADKVYGTDAQGNQTTYDVNSFGKIDNIEIHGVTQPNVNKTVDLSVIEQMTALPAPSSTYDGRVVQYIGETTATLTHNCFYECTSRIEYTDATRVVKSGSAQLVASANIQTFLQSGLSLNTPYLYEKHGAYWDCIDPAGVTIPGPAAGLVVGGVVNQNDQVILEVDSEQINEWAKVTVQSDVGVEDVLVNGTSVVTNKIAEVEVPTAVSELTNDANYQSGSQVSNTVSGAINTHNASNNAHSNLLTPITQDIDAIEEKIPAEASSSNQLADKAYVDSQIGDIDEWTTEQYTPTTTNFVVGNTYTVEEAFQRTASLFEGQQGEIDDIEAVIPAQATTQNQLADKNFVNATVATNSANFRGNWSTWAAVPTQANLYPEDYVGNRTPTNNDYMVVSDASDYTAEGMEIKIYWDGWGTHRFSVNDSALVPIGGVNEWVPFNLENDVIIYIKDFEPRYGYFGIKCNVDMLVDGSIVPAGNVVQFIESQASRTLYYYTASSSDFSGQWRFLYIGDWSTFGKAGWKPSYRIGTAFTQEQQAAIDSGITANMVDNYVNPTSTAATAYNARITAVETDKRDIINSANKVYATDNLGANKNDLVYDKTATAETIAQRGTNGVLKVGAPVDNADATTKQYVDAISGDLDDHIDDKNNPHEVTKEQVGLGNVDNTSDLNKPISTATQTALNAKQDTLTAGTNITIANNVISSTAQESFFRGNFNNWTSVPTDTSLYQEDIHGNRIPQGTDFIVIEDASQFIPVGELMHTLAIECSGLDVRITDETGVSTEYNYTYCPNNFVAIDNYYSLKYEYGAPGIWYIKTNDGSTIIVKGVTYQSGQVRLFNTDERGTIINVGMPPSAGQYTGAWRFAYYGTWSTDGKAGWIPQYKIENTLPIADSSTLGIAKLYNTTGNNTDGAVDQATVTSALGEKQDTLVSGTNIKTINNESLLGNGNITISTTTNWGGIGGTLSDQTDLQEALDKRILQDDSLSLFPVGEEEDHVGEIRQYIGQDFPLNKKFHGYFYQWTKTQLGPSSYSYGWEQWNVQPQGGGAVSDLTDVTLTDLSNGQVLVYNSSTNKWVNDDQHGGVTATYDSTTKTITFA